MSKILTTTYSCPAADKVKMEAEINISTEEKGWHKYVSPDLEGIKFASRPIEIVLVPNNNAHCRYGERRGDNPWLDRSSIQA